MEVTDDHDMMEQSNDKLSEAMSAMGEGYILTLKAPKILTLKASTVAQVVECLTREWGAVDSSLTIVIALLSLSKTLLS